LIHIDQSQNVRSVENNWELHVGLYPGFLIGFRNYEQTNCTDYVLYLPFCIDLCLTIYHD